MRRRLTDGGRRLQGHYPTGRLLWAAVEQIGGRWPGEGEDVDLWAEVDGKGGGALELGARRGELGWPKDPTPPAMADLALRLRHELLRREPEEVVEILEEVVLPGLTRTGLVDMIVAHLAAGSVDLGKVLELLEGD